MTGIYLYGVIAGEHRLSLGRLGLPNGWTQVITVPGNRLSAVVSSYRAQELDRLQKPELLRCLAIHQRAVERVMGSHLVMPAKFGTILSSRAEARALLDRWQGQLLAALQALGDTVEVEVAATWDLNAVFGEIARTPRIVELVFVAARQSAQESLATRVQIGKLVKDSLDRRREKYCQQVMEGLGPFVRDAQPNALLSDKMLLNVAFLVERARLEEFYAEVHRLDQAFNDGLTFRCIGPLPPYSFASIEVVRPRVDQIEEARRLLQVAEQVSRADLSASYRRLAARCHPDLNPDDPTAAKRFAALASAYRLLLAFIQGQRTADGSIHSPNQRGDGAEGESRQYDLSRAAVAGAVLLTIKRTGTELIQQEETSREREPAVA